MNSQHRNTSNNYASLDQIKTYLETCKDTTIPDNNCKTLKPVHEIFLLQRAYLGALLRTHLSQKGLRIDLSHNLNHNLAPTKEYREEIIDSLKSNHMITPYQSNGNISNTLYDICISDPNKTKKELVSELIFPNEIHEEEKDGWALIHFRNEVQIYEAIEYMMHTIEKFNLYSFEADERFDLLFTHILRDYSLSQLFNFIYSVVKNVAAYKYKHGNGYIPMSNFIHKGIRDKYEKAKKHNWKISKFNRPWSLPQTELSKIIDCMYPSVNPFE